jgi:hypothetical protein
VKCGGASGFCGWGICCCGWEGGFKHDPLPSVGFALVASGLVCVGSWVSCGGSSGFVVASGNVVSSTIHYLQLVLLGFRRARSALGFVICEVWLSMDLEVLHVLADWMERRVKRP